LPYPALCVVDPDGQGILLLKAKYFFAAVSLFYTAPDTEKLKKYSKEKL